jgi:hypothetical protein
MKQLTKKENKMRNSELIKYFTDQVEQKGYSTQLEGGDGLPKHYEDEIYSVEKELLVYDEENKDDQTTIYYWELCDFDEGEYLEIDEYEKIGDSEWKDGHLIDVDLTSKEEIDEFLKKRLKKFFDKRLSKNRVPPSQKRRYGLS